MATKVAGDLYVDIDGQILEIKRQLRQREGYPFDPMNLVEHLQAAIEGNFVSRSGQPLQKVPVLLEEIGIVAIPATIVPFVASERLVLNYGSKAKPGIRISYLGEDFKKWFFGKTEEPAAETTLRYAKFVKSSVDGPILVELGDKAETMLAQIYALMELQPNGEGDVLLTNGWANIFYVRDANGELRAVSVGWGGVGWGVSARPVADPFGWRGERRVFSLNS